MPCRRSIVPMSSRAAFVREMCTFRDRCRFATNFPAPASVEPGTLRASSSVLSQQHFSKVLASRRDGPIRFPSRERSTVPRFPFERCRFRFWKSRGDEFPRPRVFSCCKTHNRLPAVVHSKSGPTGRPLSSIEVSAATEPAISVRTGETGRRETRCLSLTSLRRNRKHAEELHE